MKTFRFVLISLIFVVFKLQPVLAQGYDPRHTITVSGSAEVKAAPNEVLISMSVETNNMSLDKARAENDEKVSAILVMAKQSGIEPKDIQTDYLQAEPRYFERSNAAGETTGREFLGYFVTKHIAITLLDISKFEQFIADAMKLGTNYIHETEFQTTEIRKYRDQARLEAIRAAKEKATALAGELGQKVGKPITIREEGFYQNFSSNAAPAPAEYDNFNGGKESVAPGELKIRAMVVVTFELE